jgi:hypothetical protein
MSARCVALRVYAIPAVCKGIGGSASKNWKKYRVLNAKIQEKKEAKDGSNNLEIDQGS